MPEALAHLLVFAAQTFIIVLFILILLAGVLALFSRGKDKAKGKLCIKNLNKKYAELSREINAEILPKKQFKQFIKQQNKAEKASDPLSQKKIFLC